MTMALQPLKSLRSRFDEIYDSCVLVGGFSESAEYYRIERERFWRSLQLLLPLDIPSTAKLLEIGGGQLALVFHKLFGNACAVADISEEYSAPIRGAGIDFFQYNLSKDPPLAREGSFDVVVLLEVVEHLPFPAYILLERVKRFLKPNGLIFLTTPNLFRVRNLLRMSLGMEYLDRFRFAGPDESLGHQLEYSGDHLRWQIERANMKVVMIGHDEFGRKGHSLTMRIGRALSAPLRLRPKWRDGLVAAARL